LAKFNAPFVRDLTIPSKMAVEWLRGGGKNRLGERKACWYGGGHVGPAVLIRAPRQLCRYKTLKNHKEERTNGVKRSEKRGNLYKSISGGKEGKMERIGVNKCTCINPGSSPRSPAHIREMGKLKRFL